MALTGALLAVLLVLVPRVGSAAATWILNDPQSGYDSGLGLYQVSPDGLRVLYTANERDREVADVWSVPITGGTPVRLSRYTTDPGTSPTIGITPDSQRAVWVVDADDTLEEELYSAPLRGGPQVKLHAPVVHNGGVSRDFQLSPFGQRVVYVAAQNDPSTYELFSVPADASADPIKLSPPMSEYGRVNTEIRLTPDGTRVLFAARAAKGEPFEMYSADITGADRIKLNAPLASGESVAGRNFVTPDGARVVWRVTREDGLSDLWSSPVDQPEPVQLASGLDLWSTHLRFSRDSRYLTYVADAGDGTKQLFSVDVTGGSDPVLLSTDQPVGTTARHVWHAADGHVVYTVDSRAVKTVPVTGGNPAILDGSNDHSGYRYTRLRVTPDGTTSHYLVDGPDDDLDKEARTVALPDGNPVVVAPEPTFINEATPDSQHLLVAKEGQMELAPITGGERIPVPMQPPENAIGYREPRIGPNGHYVTAEATGEHLENAHLGATALPHVTATANRVSGTDRYATAATLADRFSHADTVYLATGQDFPDALAAGPAAATEHAPILLTPADQLHDATRAQLQRLTPTTLIIVGGDTAIRPDVADAAAQAAGGAQQVRLAGSGRYATAAQAARRTHQRDAITQVVLATGTTYPDAIVGGAYAAATDAAVLLTDPHQLPDVTAEALRDLAPESLVVLGGHAAISTEVADAAASAAATDDVTRHAGPDRYATAATVARAFPEASGTLLLATGQDFPDAVAATPLAARHGAPVLLTPTDHLIAPARDAALTLDPVSIDVLGGTAAISDRVVAELHDALN